MSVNEFYNMLITIHNDNRMIHGFFRHVCNVYLANLNAKENLEG